MARKHTRFGGRTLSRSHALQLLFQAEATGRTVADVLEGDFVVTDGPVGEYAEELARGADALLDDLDAVLENESRNWSVKRMPATDRNLLRLALYEILENDEVDVAVAIDECVELARAYGTPDSPRFVNGVLGRLVERIEAGDDVVAEAHAALDAARAEAEAAAAAAAEVEAEANEDPTAEMGDDVAEADSAAVEDDGAEDVEPEPAVDEDVTDGADEGDPFAWPGEDA